MAIKARLFHSKKDLFSQYIESFLAEMAINGTGVNEAIAVVLKAAKAVAGENIKK